MMTKKKREQEETELINAAKAADNKSDSAASDASGANLENSEKAADQSKDDLAGAGGKELSADKVIAEVKAVEVKLADIQDKYIRLSAEFDNYRKRTLREKMELSKYAGEELLLKIIPIMDDFERALKHMDSTTDCKALREGIDLIYNKFSDFLKQSGIKEIDVPNGSFNVDIHEAVAKTPVNEEDKKGKVVDVVLKGYYLYDKVLRFSKVVVGE